MIKVFSYHDTLNIGDAIQTVALMKLLSGHEIGFRDRDTGHGSEPSDIHIANGFLLPSWRDHSWTPQPAAATFFAGIHMPPSDTIMDKVLAYRLPGFPIGARDWWTKNRLVERGVDVEMIGCATLTFDRYTGPRSGMYVVDVPASNENITQDCIRMTHDISPEISWNDQLTKANDFLNTYRKAEVVHTTRLHVALPCLAFGTPVVLHPPYINLEDARRRFTLLERLGVPFNEPFTTDVSKIARRYRNFVARILQAVKT